MCIQASGARLYKLKTSDINGASPLPALGTFHGESPDSIFDLCGPPRK